MSEKKIMEKIPDEVMQQFKLWMYKNEQYQEMVRKKAEAIKTGRYVVAAMLAKDIKEIEKKVLQNCIDEWQHQRKTVAEIMANCTKEELHEHNVLVNMLYVLTDMIESSVMDLNDIISKYDPKRKVILFDELNACLKQTKIVMKDMAGATDNIYQIQFGDTADDIRQLIFNKVSSMLIKVQSKKSMK